jgi:N-acetylglucosaminyl-diphospho-decaprenol L-rhamnosyltransferase
MLPSLNIIIVNWNSAHQLYECLESIANSNLSEFKLDRIDIVDNASVDNSLEHTEKFALPINIIRNSENKGFGFACNQGAANTKSDYLLFLNPDTKVFADSLSRSIDFLESSLPQKVGVVGVQLVNNHGEIHRSCTRFPSITTFLGSIIGLDKIVKHQSTSYFMTEWDHRNTQAVDQVMGAFYLIRRELFQKLGGFDESFFVYFEDLDLSYRLSQLGWSSYYLANVQSFHKGGGTSEAIKSTRLFYFIRSRILYAYKHLNWVSATIVMIASLFVEPIARIGFALIKLSLVQAQETLIAYVRLLLNYREIYRDVSQQIDK